MRLAAWLLAYAAGLAGAPFLGFSPALAAAPLLSALLWFVARRRPWGTLILLLFFATLGFTLYHLRLNPPADPGHIRAFVGPQPLTVEGRVLAVADRPPDRAAIDLEAERVGSEGIAAPVRGRVRLYLDEGSPRLHAGDRIRFQARLRPPRSFGTPGEFDYPRHLARRGVFVTAHLPRARDMAVFGRPAARSGALWIEDFRITLGRLIDGRLEPARAALVKALVIGDQGGLTPEQRDLMARGGVSHLFSISGLHFSLIALLLYAATLCLCRRSETLLLWAPPRRFLPLALMPLLLGYLLLTGNALPTRRAFLMVLAGAALLLWGRRTRPLPLLAAAALIMLVVEPLALFEASFQLSFAGVLGIVLFVPRWQERLQAAARPLRWGALMFMTTLAATIATLPLSLHHFHLLAPAGLLTNLAAVPVISFAAVPLGLAGTLLAPYWADGGLVLLQGCGLVTETVLRGVAWVIGWPPLAGWKLYLPLLSTAGSALLGAAMLLGGESPRQRVYLAATLASGTVLLLWPAAPPAGLTVTALSVGQGEALLLTRPDGRHYLIDGGGIPGGTFDVGERLLAPALGRLGVRSLEAVILTHDHPDHREGLQHVLEHFPVGAFWSAEAPDALDPALADVLQRREIPAVHFAPGWTTLQQGEGETLALFAPEPTTDSPNDRSLVLYSRLGRDAVLLTGDLEQSGVEALLASSLPGPVNLLKLPHHGSRHSAPQLLLESLHPQLAFASAGAGNPHRLPHAEVVADLAQRGIPLWRTDLHGSLRFHCSGDGWRAERWQQGLFR